MLHFIFSEKLGYIGYSEGSTFGLLLMATQARYNEILKPVILMAFGLVSSKNTSVSSTDVLFAATLSQVALPLFPKLKLTSTVLTAVCSPPVQDVCAYILGYITGYDNANFNKTRFPVYLSQSPAGTSSWIFAQYSHNNNVHCFSYFNSNPVDNKRKYGTETAPCYNMTRVTNRFISAYIGQNDQRSPYSDYALSLLGGKFHPNISHS
ncbi:Gastric triacylglycerol lipase [Halotydeus destructor]|nr:Gastric triacylglycerol lipase [Halotydeus destructor]